MLACVGVFPALSAGNRSLLIVVDGLRPDYITPELMPNLHALGEAGAVGKVHSSIYPTFTRVNSASIKYPDGFQYETEMHTMHVGTALYLRGASTKKSDSAKSAE